MLITPKIFIALIITALLAGCSTGDTANSNANSATQTANSNNQNNIKDDVEELEMIIKMPFHPEEAVWREDTLGKPGNDRIPGPTDKKLLAVLRFLKADADKIALQAETYKPVLNESINTETWFPAELIAQSRTSGDGTVKGTSYAANDFYNMPYTAGKITRIEGTDYFVLELYSR